MDTDEIIGEFAEAKHELPIRAILWCRDEWDAVAPTLLGLLARYEDGTDRSDTAENALFFALFLFGERRETRAFAPLCRLAHDIDALEAVLGDGVTESLASILLGTYDGDAGSLERLIEAPNADEFVRAAALDAYGFLAASGRIETEIATRYLLQLFDSMPPQEESYIWFTWALIITLLRIDGAAELIDQAFARGLMPLEMGDEDDYRTMRDEALGDPDPLSSFQREGIKPIDDAIDLLSGWDAFNGSTDDEDFSPVEQVFNPFRDVGRNDPCPCGSGKKFKKCCLGVASA
jgi:uncharacterized protein